MTKPSAVHASPNFAYSLTLVACAAWCLSLALPGFMVASQARPYWGIEILFFGILFGWAVGGWAAYANLFFCAAALMLISGRSPRWTILPMLALACTLPAFKGVFRDEGSMLVLPVLSWGWGALAWLISLGLLSIAAANRAGLITAFGAKTLLPFAGLFVLAGSVLHLRQNAWANDQERDSFLSPSMVFTRAEYCRMPLTRVGTPLLAPGTVVTLDIDPRLTTEEPYLSLPSMQHYTLSEEARNAFFEPHPQQGSDWANQPPRVDSPILQARRLEKGAVLRLLSGQTGKVLYEQKFNIVRHGDRQLLCPFAAQGSWVTGLKTGFDLELLRAIGQGPSS